MILKCDYPATIVKGLIEHGDGHVYFASFGGYPTYLAMAQTMGWVSGDKEVTEAGKAMYEAERLDLLPQKGDRAYLWDWGALRGTREVVSSDYVSVSFGMPPTGSTCDASNLQDGTWYLNRLLVARPYQGQGIGWRLLKRVTELLQGKGVLIVDPGGYDSSPVKLQKWYLRQGFEKSSLKGRLRFEL